MIKICIFDLDGTLAATQESIARPVNMTLALYGLPPQPAEAFNYFAGDGLKNALKRALIASGGHSSGGSSGFGRHSGGGGGSRGGGAGRR